MDENRDSIFFEVTDTGIGMSSEQLKHVFEPFTQADNSTTRKYGGTGLGLAIIKSFCTMLGGEISATSVAGDGSTFVVRLPAIVEDLEFTEHKQAAYEENKLANLPIQKAL